VDTFKFIHLPDAFIQSTLQMRTIEPVKLTVVRQIIPPTGNSHGKGQQKRFCIIRRHSLAELKFLDGT